MYKNKLLLILLLISCYKTFSQQEQFLAFNHKCIDTVTRPYALYIPKAIINTNQKIPLLVYLHGAISSKKINKKPIEYLKKSKLITLAAQGKFMLLFPYGQEGATWFDEVGKTMVFDEIEEVTKKYPIDKNKIFLSGFSDGASGVFHIALTEPSKFAGFIALNGHVRVATKLGKEQGYPENMNNKPLYVINTKKDMLYPSEKIYPIIDELKKYNKNITYKSLDGNHQMKYLEQEKEVIISFIKKNNNSFPKEISLTSNTSLKRYSWITIQELDTIQKAKKWHKHKNAKMLNDKAYFGLKYDYSYKGNGLKVKGFKSDTCTAKKMGVRKGDIVFKMENDTIKSYYTPYYYKAKKLAGDTTSLTIFRDEDIVVLKGKFNQGYYYPLFNFRKASGKIKASIKQNVVVIQSSRIKKIGIDFSKLPYDENKKVTIKINNKKVAKRKIDKKEQLTFVVE